VRGRSRTYLICLMEYLTSTKAQLLVSVLNELVRRVVMLQFMAPLLGVCKRQVSGHGNEPKISTRVPKNLPQRLEISKSIITQTPIMRTIMAAALPISANRSQTYYLPFQVPPSSYTANIWKRRSRVLHDAYKTYFSRLLQRRGHISYLGDGSLCSPLLS
jgi:hypothetical protein